MVMTDPVADMLTRMRNAMRIGRATASMPSSRLKVGIASALKREGFIEDYSVQREGERAALTVTLRYGENGEKVITKIVRESRPGRRVYCAMKDLPRVLGGMGIAVVSTPRGVLSDREARRLRVGGEVLCKVW
ncbi:MAG: 30S ribosomal protein S8 [Planctomycetota bacterium]